MARKKIGDAACPAWHHKSGQSRIRASLMSAMPSILAGKPISPEVRDGPMWRK
jgi:hypothetical protein